MGVMISLRVLHPCGFETRCIFTRDRCRSPVTTVGWVGVGWGGDGVITFLAHVHIFDAPALQRKPGIMSALTALQLYRNDCSRGTISIAPKDAFVPESLTWLD